uniref:3-hydroxyacyl-CoA dehydrogenase type-2 n=1 Tax=Strongyloides venezuelensis TaxID=75913 RepID=A0A0K0EWI6_STRVS
MSGLIKNISGRIALVTGACSGLGRGVAERLVSQGVKVAVLDLPQTNGEEVVNTLGPNAIFVPADVSDETSVKTALDTVKEKYGKLDTIVNCAGVAFAFKLYSKKSQFVYPNDNITRTFNVNILGTFNVIRYGVPLIMENKMDDQNQRGVIINTASIAAYDGQIGQSVYSASKGAIVGATLPLARELKEDGIRVMAIAPGLFETPMLASLPTKVREFLVNTVPNPGRFGSPEEFAALVQHIMENCYLNGEVIRLDAALRMMP